MADRLVIGVVGSGTMGRGIAQWAATAGHPIVLYDSRPGAVEEARDFITGILARAVQKGRLGEDERHAIIGRIGTATAIADLAAADVVIEAVLEDIEVKRAVFAELEEVVPDTTILCTNTSSLSVTACAAATRRPERVVGLHFFNPVPLMKVVEIVRAQRTAPEAIERLQAIVRPTGHRAIVCDDTPGFVINHAGRGLSTEGLRIVQERVGTFADVDRVMREAAGFPMGPFELFDLTGLDVSREVMRQIYGQFYQEPRLRPTPLADRRVTAGLFGRKSGGGFYSYDNGKRIDPPETAPSENRAGSVHVVSDDPAITSLIAATHLQAAGSAESADAIVVAPLGDDATNAAVRAGLDARRVLAIDPLFPKAFEPGGRITLMTTPVTERSTADMVHAALLAAGHKVTRISDSPGFIAQRTIATIVNIGSEIAQQGIAAPSDIDDAVRRGLGYPAGPLTLGDQVGPARIVEILSCLQECTGDPRYRPSLWLRRRAQLGVSLLTDES